MLVVLGKPLVHICEARVDAVLLPFQDGQLDGVGEVRSGHVPCLRE